MFTPRHSSVGFVVTEDEKELFRRAVAGAKRLESEQRAPESPQKPPPVARFRRQDESDVMFESLDDDIDTLEHESGGAIRFMRQSVGRRTMRKLARGGYSVQAEIDLHGMTVAEAKPRLMDFVQYSAMSGLTCVRVVHGKGLGSGERGPVLKSAVNRWLRKWENVLAYVSTRQVDGGTGAIYVLLQKT